MFKGILLLLFGFIISHFATALLLSVLYSKHFYILSPFALISYCISTVAQHHFLSKLPIIALCFYIIFSSLPLLVYRVYCGNKTNKNKYGYAKFADESLIRKMKLNFSEGIVFGILKQTSLQKLFHPFASPSLIRSKEPLSTLLMAPPGTGKTAGIIIPTLLTITNSVVVHDPKGELYDTTHQARLRLGHKVFFFDIDEADSIRFNPFAKNKIPKDPEQIKPYIVNIANIIFKSSSKESVDNTNYFIGAARNAFIAVACFLTYKEGFTSLLKVRDKIVESDDIIRTFKEMKEDDLKFFKVCSKKLKKMLDGDINSVLISSASPDQWAGVMGSLTEKLDYFSDPKIATIVDCEESYFNAEALRKEKVSIYLRVKDKDKNKMKPVISMIFESLGSELISKIPEAGDNQITFILDEFVRLGRVDVLTDLTSISRGYNFNQIFVIQDLEQISNTYSKEYMSILESNCAYKIILKQNNFMTAERISKIIGAKTDIKTSRSKKEANIISNSKNNSTNSISTSQEGIPLVTPQDILNLHEDQCLIIVQGFAATPILANIAWFFKMNSPRPRGSRYRVG